MSATDSQLRALVRQLIVEAVPQLASGSSQTRVVRITNDAELQAFVRTIVGMLDDPSEGAAIRSGTVRFQLDGVTQSQAAPSSQPGASVAPAATATVPSLEVEKGAITEKVVARAAAAGTRRIVAGPRAVVTPLAREQMRKFEITLERRTC